MPALTFREPDLLTIRGKPFLVFSTKDDWTGLSGKNTLTREALEVVGSRKV
jgi:hypothetical protein